MLEFVFNLLLSAVGFFVTFRVSFACFFLSLIVNKIHFQDHHHHHHHHHHHLSPIIIIIFICVIVCVIFCCSLSIKSTFQIIIIIITTKHNTQNERHGNQREVTKGDERMKDW